MTEQNVFSIEWNKEIPDSNVGPATDEEITATMVLINEKAKVAKPGEIISIKLRTEVVDAVEQGINSSGSGAASSIDLSENKFFDKNRGVFISTLYVAKDGVILSNYIDGF